MLVQFRSILGVKRIIRRYGGLTRRHQNYLRNALSSAALIITPVSQQLASKPFLLTLEKRKFFIDFKDKLMIMNSHIQRIQQKFIDRAIFRDAKIEMLKLYWTHVLAWIIKQGCKCGNSQVKAVSAYIMSIDKKIQDHVLRRLLV